MLWDFYTYTCFSYHCMPSSKLNEDILRLGTQLFTNQLQPLIHPKKTFPWECRGLNREFFTIHLGGFDTINTWYYIHVHCIYIVLVEWLLLSVMYINFNIFQPLCCTEPSFWSCFRMSWKADSLPVIVCKSRNCARHKCWVSCSAEWRSATFLFTVFSCIYI